MNKLKYRLIVITFLFTNCFGFWVDANGDDLIVNSFYGNYDSKQKKPGFPSDSLEGPVLEKWNSPKRIKEYHIGILFPHLEDSYWLAANYGIYKHAKESGLKITLYSAGGYIKFNNQEKQFMTLAKKTDGIILASVDYSKMDRTVRDVTASGIPVVSLINDITAPEIKAKASVSFFEMGYKAGEYVVKDSEGKNIKVAFFPGPENSGWAPETYTGFVKAVYDKKSAAQKITVLEPLYGDTRPDVQRLRLKYLLDKTENSNIDYIVGCAVAVNEAVNYLNKNRKKHPEAKVVSTYITPDVFKQIEQGNVIASPSDQPIIQCKIALDMMVRILNGEQPGKDFPFRAGPVIPVISKDNIAEYKYEELFGEKNYVPVTDSAF